MGRPEGDERGSGNVAVLALALNPSESRGEEGKNKGKNHCYKGPS